MPSHVPLKTTNFQENLCSRIVISTDGKEEIEKYQMGRGLWVTDIDPLCTKTIITTNFEPEADEAVVMQCPISSAFFMLHILLVKVRY